MHAHATAPGTRHRAKGALLLISAIAIGVLTWLILTFLADALQKNPEVARDLPPFALECIQSRTALPLFVVPAALAALILFAARLRSGLAWMLLVFGLLWNMACFGLVLYVFLSFIAPLYQYHPL